MDRKFTLTLTVACVFSLVESYRAISVDRIVLNSWNCSDFCGSSFGAFVFSINLFMLRCTLGQEPTVSAKGSWAAGALRIVDNPGMSNINSAYLSLGGAAAYWLLFCAWFLLSSMNPADGSLVQRVAMG